MGSFSIWHWIIVVVLVGVPFAIYFFAKRYSSASIGGGAPSGVGGWLLVLVVGLMFFGPLSGVGSINAQILSVESQYPNLIAVAEWGVFKSATWYTFLLVGCLSFYAGFGLAKGRTSVVVKRAHILLWVIGPVAVIVMGLLIPLVIFGEFAADAQFFGTLFASVISSGVWSAYLSRSRRVKATYNELSPMAPQSNSGSNQMDARRHNPEPEFDLNKIYAQIDEEIDSKEMDKGLWTRLWAECDGDDKQARVKYIRRRAEMLVAQLRCNAHSQTSGDKS